MMGGGEPILRPQQIFPKAELRCFRLDIFLPYRFQGNEGKRQAGVGAEPKQEGDVEGGLGQGLAGSADLGGAASGSTRTGDVSEGGVSDVGQLGGVADHLEVGLLLLRRHGKLVPDVHPVAVVLVDALATDLDLHSGDELLAGEIQPTGINGAAKALVDLGESDLEVGAERHVAVTGDGACHATTEVSLTRESLLNALDGKVGVSAVGDLPEGNLGDSGQERVLCAIGD